MDYKDIINTREIDPTNNEKHIEFNTLTYLLLIDYEKPLTELSELNCGKL